MCFGACACDWLSFSNDQIANAIYKAENSTKYPYGIMSIDTKGNKDYARKICINTIQHARVDYQKEMPKDLDFIEYLSNRYCPPSCDFQGNINWRKNVKYFLTKGVK